MSGNELRLEKLQVLVFGSIPLDFRWPLLLCIHLVGLQQLLTLYVCLLQVALLFSALRSHLEIQYLILCSFCGRLETTLIVLGSGVVLRPG